MIHRLIFGHDKEPVENQFLHLPKKVCGRCLYKKGQQ